MPTDFEKMPRAQQDQLSNSSINKNTAAARSQTFQISSKKHALKTKHYLVMLLFQIIDTIYTISDV